MRGLLKGIAAVAAVVCAFAAPATAARATAHRAAADPSLEHGVLGEINSFRASHHPPPLRLNVKLSAAAGEQSGAMARKGFFAHESADARRSGSASAAT